MSFCILLSSCSSKEDIEHKTNHYNYDVSYKKNRELSKVYHEAYSYSDSLFAWYWKYFISEHKGTMEEADSMLKIVSIAQDKTLMLADSLNKSFEEVDSLFDVLWSR